MQVSGIKPINKDVPLTREDCLELFRKHNCTPARLYTQLCADLNECINAADQKQCFVVKGDDE